jgi:hypothetical protein
MLILTRVADPYPDPNRIQIKSGQWIRIRIRNLDPDPGGQRSRKVKKFHVLKCWMFSFESFFCNLDVLYGSLGIGEL